VLLQLDDIAVGIRDVSTRIAWRAVAALDKPPTRRLTALRQTGLVEPISVLPDERRRLRS
jgi:hypothetical protein